MSKKITAGALALIAVLNKGGEVINAVDAVERYATEIVIPVVEKMATAPLASYGPRFGQCIKESLSRSYRAMLGLISGMARLSCNPAFARSASGS